MKKTYETALRCALAAMLLWGMSAQARDIVITTTKSEYVPGGVRYYFVVNSWGDDWIPSLCSTNDPAYTVCDVRLTARIISSYNFTVGRYNTWSVPPRSNSDMGELLKDLESKGFRIPLSGSIFVSSKYAPSELCIGFDAVKVGPNIGGAPSRLGPCPRVAVPSLQCDITGYAVIDHKSLMDNAVDGATASTQVYVQCHGPASLSVSTSRTDSYGIRLKSDGSLYSKITVNGKDATAGINVPITQDQPTPLTITSTLVKRGNVTPGQFSGSTIVTISPP
ncbi:MrpH family fimbial adhesin [Pseudomonas chlororaphis]